MGHSIPVMYFACDASELPTYLLSWIDAQVMLTNASNNRAKYHLHCATGRNWWHVRTIADVRDHNRLTGLDFIDREVAVVRAASLTAAIDSFRKLIVLCRNRYNLDEVPEQSIPNEIECDNPGGFEQFLGSLLYVMIQTRNDSRDFVFVQPQP